MFYKSVSCVKTNMVESLYLGSKCFTRLSVVLILFNLEARVRWPNKSFTELLELLQEMLLEGNIL